MLAQENQLLYQTLATAINAQYNLVNMVLR